MTPPPPFEKDFFIRLWRIVPRQVFGLFCGLDPEGILANTWRGTTEVVG